MRSSFQIARIAGIPVRVHITLLIVLPLFALGFAPRFGTNSLFWGFICAVGLFASVVLHEVGHSIVAARKGCRVREILLLPIGGVAQLERMPTRPRDEFHVAIAGPIVSLGLAFLGLSSRDLFVSMHMNELAVVVSTLGFINLVLALFNLLPSFPMDGGRIFRAWLSPKIGRLAATSIAAKVGRFMAVVFGIIGLLPPINIFLILIALFIYQAAGSEYRMVRIQEAMRQNQQSPWMKSEEMWPYDEDQIIVSPPPYRRNKAPAFFVRPFRAQHDLFDDLFEKWR